MFEKYIDADANIPEPPDAATARGIDTLPPEVMLKIFQVLAAATPGNVLVRWDHERVPREWLVVNLVCRYWRRLACGFPVLWRAIDVGGCVEWMQLCLVRSGSAPLDIRLYNHTTLFQAAALLLNHTERIRSLIVTDDAAANSLHALGSLFMVGMPALEELYLDACRLGAPLAGKCLYDVFLLNRTSENIFPSLRTLHLSGLYLPPTASLLRGLRVLELVESHPGSFANQLTFEEFLDALEACPTLEKLKLWSSFPFRIDRDNVDRVVALPNLRLLSLLCPSDHGNADSAVKTTRCSYLLSHLRLAESTAITVFAPVRLRERKSFLDHIPNNPACLPILRAANQAILKGAWEFAVSMPCPCAECSRLDSELLHMHPGDGETACDKDTGGLSMILVNPCRCSADDSVGEEDAAVREFAELFVAAPLRRLELFYGASQVGFGHLFSSFRGLFVLALECCGYATRDNMRDFVYALAGPLAWGSEGARLGESDTAPMPQLRWLCVHQACWYGELAQDLETCLRSRKAKGAGKLQELHVVLKSAKGTKRRKLNNMRETKLRALASLVETVNVEFMNTRVV